MPIASRALLLATVVACLIAVAGCSTAGTNRNNGNLQRNANVPAVSTTNGNAAGIANKSAPASPAARSEGGTIEVRSTPAGASVLLIRDEDGGAGQPKPYGSTPTTLSGIAPGKYTVDIEKPGFKYYQEEIVVKNGATIRIDARLVKQ